LYSDKSLEGEYILIRTFLLKTKNTSMAGGWKLKFTFYVMETTHERLQLNKWSCVLWTITNICKAFISIIIFFDGAFGCSGISKFWVYAWTNAEIHCVTLCNFGLCHIFVSYLSSYFKIWCNL
jgi:hypothetical protein